MIIGYRPVVLILGCLLLAWGGLDLLLAVALAVGAAVPDGRSAWASAGWGSIYFFIGAFLALGSIKRR